MVPRSNEENRRGAGGQAGKVHVAQIQDNAAADARQPHVDNHDDSRKQGSKGVNHVLEQLHTARLACRYDITRNCC